MDEGHGRGFRSNGGITLESLAQTRRDSSDDYQIDACSILCTSPLIVGAHALSPNYFLRPLAPPDGSIVAGSASGSGAPLLTTQLARCIASTN